MQRPTALRLHPSHLDHPPPQKARPLATAAPSALSAAARYYRDKPTPRLNPDGTVVTLAPPAAPAPPSAPTTPGGSREATPSPGSPLSSADLVPSSSSSLEVAPDRVQVTFVVPEYVTSYGQVLKVVGALEELGAWSPDKVGALGVGR